MNRKFGLKKLHSRGALSFLTTLLACGAFLVGAVRIWGVPEDKLVSGFFAVLILLIGLIAAAFIVVVVIKLVTKKLSAGKRD